MSMLAKTDPSTIDPPFGMPLDEQIIILDLPIPPSVNRTRRVNWAAQGDVAKWKDRAFPLVLWSHSKYKGQPKRIEGPFELIITVSPKHTSIDLDNGLKVLIDYLRHIDSVENDSKRFLRRLSVQWGEAPEGVRVQIIGLAGRVA